MSGVKMLKGLKEKTRGLKDPGTAPIVVYMSIILFLLLFAGLESVRADDLDGTKEKTVTMDDVHRGELLTPRREEGRYIATPFLSRNMKTSAIGMTAKTAIPSELFRVLGYILLLFALLLAKDGKKR